MNISKDIVQPFNDQIKSEFTASAQYIAIAIYFDELGMIEMAKFFYRQSDEERTHAMKFVHFMLETDAKPIIPTIPELRNSFNSPTDAVAFALAQEQEVTDQINNLANIAVQEGDHASNNFLQWFITEQVEEVSTMTTLLQTIDLSGGNMLLVEDFVLRNPQHEEEAF